MEIRKKKILGWMKNLSKKREGGRERDKYTNDFSEDK